MKNKFNTEYFSHHINKKIDKTFENLSDTISETLLTLELLYTNTADLRETNYNIQHIDLIALNIDDTFTKHHLLILEEIQGHLNKFFENNKFGNL